MNLTVVGTGLVSALGTRTAHHVFMVRADCTPPWPPPFTAADGSPIAVRYCPWLGGHSSYAVRVAAMLAAALEEALEGVDDLVGPEHPGDTPGPGRELDRPALLCIWGETARWSSEELAEIEAAMQKRVRARSLARFVGAASLAGALQTAAAELAGGARAVVIVTADCFVDLDAADAVAARPPTPWEAEGPPLGEGAAAIVLTGPALARQLALPTLGIIKGASSHASASNDDNQEIVDGAAMTAVLRDLPIEGQVHVVSGQFLVDELRETEWHMASARNAAKLEVLHADYSLECDTGLTGGAAGLMALVYGLGAMRHQATPRLDDARGPLVAWAISRDGTRGGCLAQPA